jgi:putative glutamine amidotransferase
VATSEPSHTDPPRVGITGYLLGPEEARSRRFGERVINAFALAYFERASDEGLLPLPLPVVPDDPLETYLDLVHGVVLTGGEDVGPEHYGHEPHPELGRVVPERDRFELNAARAAMGRGLPILAICRGIQLLNVALGGTLVQHLEPSAELRHWPEDIFITPNGHAVDIVDPSLIALIGSDRAEVNSYHHQAVLQPGSGLRVAACAGDVIEAIIAEEPAVLGVQWHPETMDAVNPAARAPFGWLAEQVRRRAGTEPAVLRDRKAT